ncbi:hydrogenase iron-sulfur subunit [bacterium]|nr:hydrogenase iron-sulfur subunit [bacterium]
MTHRPLKLYIFCCSTHVDTEALGQRLGENSGDVLKTVSIPCSGKVDVLYLIKTFETGADGVIIVTCRNGECRYIEGNLRAGKRAEAVDALLREIGLDGNRISVIQIEEDGMEKLIGDIEHFRAELKQILFDNEALSSSAQGSR